MATAERLELGGRVVRLSNPDKVLYPSTGTTKRDVVDYLVHVADALLPHATGRAVTRKRWVDGVGTARKPGAVFFQKNLERGAPEWLETVEIQHSDGKKTYPIVTSVADLAWMANMAALELHVPQWRADRSKVETVDSEQQHPDRLVLDLDPGEGADLEDCAHVALLVRELLVEIGLEPFPLTSGSKGIHLYAPLDGTITSRQASDLAHQLARSLEELHPDLVVSEMRKAKRRGKVMVDWSQNSAAKTTVAPYSLRGRLRPTVAAPRTWDEIEAGGLEQLEFGAVLDRLERDGDLLAGLDAPAGEAKRRGLPAKERRSTANGTRATEHRAGAAGGDDADDRLTKYRSMRSADRTPEPVPSAAPRAREERTFVIQRHQARRLHHDFRLEHDGVLVSWAVPKGPPETPKQQRLAVQTEDHPIEYGSFEGEIPKGEYGAGTVEIWDAGTFELEKWRDDEVIATLHGKPDGGLGGEPYRFALIRTNADKRQWLLHKMKEQPGDDADGTAPADAASAKRGRAEHGAPTAAKRAGAASAKRAGQRSSPAGTTRRRGSRREREAIRPMLATLGSVADIEDEREWSFEVKWDGWRVIAEVEGGRVRLLSRSGGELTDSFPDLAASIAEAVEAGSAVLDGEVVVLGKNGHSDFQALQSRAGLTGRDARRAAERTPVSYLAFDLLELDGERLVDEPLVERQSALDEHLHESRRVRISKPLRGSLEHVLDVTRERGLEGVIAKQHDSRYRLGVRSHDWLKLKHQRSLEVVVVGWLEGKGSLAGEIGSLVLALPEGRALRYAGRVGTGFDMAERRRLRERLRSRRTAPRIEGLPADVAKRIHWVRSAVGEVEHAERTAAGSLRHPVWRGLRTDKRVTDLNPE